MPPVIITSILALLLQTVAPNSNIRLPGLVEVQAIVMSVAAR